MLAAVRRRLRVGYYLRRYRVAANALYDAQLTPPQPTESAPSVLEQRLLEDLDQRVGALSRSRASKLKSLKLSLLHGNLAAELPGVDDVVRSYLVDVDLVLTQFQRTHARARDITQVRQRELVAFKADHLLHRDAHYHPLILTIGVLLLAVMIELVGSAILLADLSPAGILGAISTAAMLQTLTVPAAFLVGFGALRAMADIRDSVRVCGWIGFVLLVALVAVGLLTSAHVRLFLERNPDVTELMAIDWRGLQEQISARPFAVFGAPTSTALYIAGVVGGLLAVVEGLLCNDPYFGFAAVDRRYRAAIDDLERLTAEYIARITTLSDKAIALVNRRDRQAARLLNSARHELARADVILERFDCRIAEERTLYTQLLGHYRATNRRHRLLSTLPSRFNTPTLPPGMVETPAYDPALAGAHFRQARDNIRRRADDAVAKILAARLDLTRAAHSPNASVGSGASAPLPPELPHVA